MAAAELLEPERTLIILDLSLEPLARQPVEQVRMRNRSCRYLGASLHCLKSFNHEIDITGHPQKRRGGYGDTG